MCHGSPSQEGESEETRHSQMGTSITEVPYGDTYKYLGVNQLLGACRDRQQVVIGSLRPIRTLKTGTEFLSSEAINMSLQREALCGATRLGNKADKVACGGGAMQTD